MLNALGPVIGNHLADAHRATLKPHLRERLALQASRNTPLGTIDTSADGRLTFVPRDAPLSGQHRMDDTPRVLPPSAFQPGQRVRVCAAAAELLAQEVFPFAPEDARALAGCEGEVIEDRQCSKLGLVLLLLDRGPWAFMPAYLQHLPASEGDDEPKALASGPSFDPYSEPLAVGDTVRGRDGCIGRVMLVEPQRLGVSFECGSDWCGAASWRSSFRLLAKAAPMPTAAAWGSAQGCSF